MPTREELITIALLLAFVAVIYNLKSTAYILLILAAMLSMIIILYYLLDNLLTKITECCLLALAFPSDLFSPSDFSPESDEACFYDNSSVPPGAYPALFTRSYVNKLKASTSATIDALHASLKEAEDVRRYTVWKEQISAADIRELEVENAKLKEQRPPSTPLPPPPCSCAGVDVEALKRCVSRKEEELSQAQSDIGDLQVKLSSAMNGTTPKRSVRFILPADNARSGDAKKIAMRQELAALKKETSALKSTSQSQHSDRQLAHRNRQLSAENAKLTSRSWDLTTQNRLLTTNAQATISAHSTELSRVNNKLAATKTTLDSKTTQLEQVTSELSSISANTVSLDAFKRVSEELTTAKDTITTYLAEGKQLQSAFNSTKDDLQAATEELSSTKDSLEITKAAYEGTENDLEAKVQELQGVRTRLNQLDFDYATLQVEFADKGAEMGKMQDLPGAKEREIQELRQELAREQVRAATETATHRDLEAKVARMDTEKRRLVAGHAEQRARDQELIDEAEDIKNRDTLQVTGALNAEIVELQMQLQDIKAATEKDNKDRKEYSKSSVADLKKQLSGTQAMMAKKVAMIREHDEQMRREWQRREKAEKELAEAKELIEEKQTLINELKGEVDRDDMFDD